MAAFNNFYFDWEKLKDLNVNLLRLFARLVIKSTCIFRFITIRQLERGCQTVVPWEVLAPIPERLQSMSSYVTRQRNWRWSGSASKKRLLTMLHLSMLQVFELLFHYRYFQILKRALLKWLFKVLNTFVKFLLCLNILISLQMTTTSQAIATTMTKKRCQFLKWWSDQTVASSSTSQQPWLRRQRQRKRKTISWNLLSWVSF